MASPTMPGVTQIESVEFRCSLEDAVADDGTVPDPDGPGLGVECVWDYVYDNRTGEIHEYE